MSETARIREAARALHRQRPDDNRSEKALEAAQKVTAVQMADKYRELAQRATMDLQRRIVGLEGLFGEDVARPISDAAEELREAFYASLDQHELARHTVDRYVMNLRTQHAAAMDELREIRNEAQRLLQLAADDEDARMKRRRKDARTPAPWYRKAHQAGYVDNGSPF